MKKILFTLPCILWLFSLSQAQNPVPVTKPKPKNPTKTVLEGVKNRRVSVTEVLPTTTRPDWVEISEFGGFTGRKARYAENVPEFSYPASFTNKRAISLKVAHDYIAYITFKEGQATEGLFAGDYEDFGARYPLEIQSIRVVGGMTAYVNLSGISTQIHNNDCRRIFGNIRLQVKEELPTGALVPCPVVAINGTRSNPGARDAHRPVLIFDQPNSFSRRPTYHNYVFSSDGHSVPEITSWVSSIRSDYVGARFLVNQQAVREHRIILEFTTDLGSQHKSGDLATDYSSDVRMSRPETISVNYYSSPAYFNIGPFTAQGNPNNNYGQASGVRYSIQKTLRVHFNKERSVTGR